MPRLATDAAPRSVRRERRPGSDIGNLSDGRLCCHESEPCGVRSSRLDRTYFGAAFR